MQEFLAAHPGLDRRMFQLLSLHDAAGVLDVLKPPHGDTAAEFLREVGNHLMREAGVPEDFLQAMIASRPVGPGEESPVSSTASR